MSAQFATPILAAVVVCGLSGTVAAQSLGDPVLSWGYNSYGVSGLIDMPTAHSRADGELSLAASWFQNQGRVSLSFQIADRLSGTFRYALLRDVRADPGSPVNRERYDRSFSMHYRLMNEGDLLPALAFGLNDILGTGMYAGEYLVASKTLTPRLRATLGLGWGRLGSYGGFGNPLGVIDDRFETRPPGKRRAGGEGGTLQASTWFRGDAAFFGGLEWQASDRMRLVAEYSSDAYEREDDTAFAHRSPINLGVTYQATDRLSVDARYLYGSELGLQLTYALNPKHSAHGSGRDAAPRPVLPRHAAAAATWQDVAQDRFDAGLKRDFAREGLRLEGVEADGDTLRVRLQNQRYSTATQALGRAARVMTHHAPQQVERFVLILSQNGMPVTKVTLKRDALAQLEFNPVAGDLLRAQMVVTESRSSLGAAEGAFPSFSYGLGPYVTPSYFDPDSPLRMDAGLALSGRYEPFGGLVFSATVQQKLLGNIADSDRPSDSVLPHVRTDAALYAKGGDTKLREMTAAYYFRPAEDFYGRVTAGYLETMFGGVSSEILWKPQNSALALGAELNYARQRDFSDAFGFQDYGVTTGHVSAYYEFSSAYQAQLDVGRYLAGDKGITLTLAREFDNGWRIAAFATKTNVSAKEFGEGSFDKGISLTIPLAWSTGQATKNRYQTVIRSVERDGGARLSVSGRLYEEVRALQATELDESWGRFWK